MIFPHPGALTTFELIFVLVVSSAIAVSSVTFVYLIYAFFTKREQTRLAMYARISAVVLGAATVVVAGAVLNSQPKGEALEKYNTAVVKYMDKSYGLTITKAETWKLIDLKPATVTTADGRIEKVRLTSIMDEDPELIAEDLTTIPKLTQKER